MELSITTNQNVTAPSVPSMTASANSAPPAISTPQAAASDSVSISDQAQQALAASNTSPTTDSGNAAATALPSWSSQAVTDALTALNDTSGSTSITDQISAYNLMTQMVSNGTNFDPSNTANSSAVDIATAFQTSAFAQHAQSLADQMFAYNNQPGVSASEAGQRKLDYFNALSSDDQQIAVATMGASAVAQGQQPIYSSVQSYTANLQASVNVNRALEAAYANPTYVAGMSANMPSENVDANTAQQMALQKQATAAGDTATVALVALKQANLTGDAFTAAANAYFAEYGPPPAETDTQEAEDAAPAPSAPTTKIDASAIRAGYQGLTILNDSSGNVSAADAVAAWKQAQGDIAKVGGAPNLTQISLTVNFWNSNASTRIGKAQDAYDNASWAGRGGTEVSSVQNQISAFNALSSDDQIFVAGTGAMPGYAATPEGYISYLTDGLKNAAQGDAINAASRAGNQTLYHQLIANLVDYTNKTGVAMNGAAPAPGNAGAVGTQNSVKPSNVAGADDQAETQSVTSLPVDSKTMMDQAVLKLFTNTTTKSPVQSETGASDAKKSGVETSLEAIIADLQSKPNNAGAFVASPKSNVSLGGNISQSA